MKRISIIAMLVFTSSSAMADWYRYGYDPVDTMAENQISAISAQEQFDVMDELQEGDFREAQQIMQRDEAIKYQIRRNEALYDQARDMNRYDYGYYGYDD